MLSRRPLLVIALAGLVSGGCAGGASHADLKRSPYTVRGVRYVPMTPEAARDYEARGVASWYGPERRWFFFGGGEETTANGEKITSRSLSAAHRLLPLPCTVEVTNLRNGRRAKLRVNDRGPFVGGRILDVSARAAEKLDFKEEGLTEVSVRVLKVGG